MAIRPAISSFWFRFDGWGWPAAAGWVAGWAAGWAPGWPWAPVAPG
jgi:hypothetical protein